MAQLSQLQPADLLPPILARRMVPEQHVVLLCAPVVEYFLASPESKGLKKVAKWRFNRLSNLQPLEASPEMGAFAGNWFPFELES